MRLSLVLVALAAAVAHALPTPTTTPIPVAAGVLYGDQACAYSAELSLGAQTFRLIADSGSANVAVAAASCASCADVSPLYEGFVPDGAVGSISYGDGSSISGPLASDEVALAPGFDPVGIQFMAITTQNDFFSCNNPQARYQGILGLAYGQLAQNGASAFMDELARAGVPEGFALQLCDVQDVNTGRSGNYWLGGVDTTHAASPFTYVTITQKLYYNVQVQSMALGGVDIMGLQSADASAPWIVDSGTSAIVFKDQSDFDVMVEAIRASGVVTVNAPPNVVNSFWRGSVGLGSNQITFNPSVNLTVTLQGPDGPSTLVVQTKNYIVGRRVNTNTVYFFEGFQVSTTLNINILGITLLKNLLVFFDRGSKNRIGFAFGANCNVAATAAGINVYASSDARTVAPQSLVVLGVGLLVMALIAVLA